MPKQQGNLKAGEGSTRPTRRTPNRKSRTITRFKTRVAAEDLAKSDSPVPTSKSIALAKSPSKRHFLKVMLLAGGAATLAIGLPRAVSASSLETTVTPLDESTAKSTPPTLKLSRVFRFNDPETGAPQISDFPTPIRRGAPTSRYA